MGTRDVVNHLLFEISTEVYHTYLLRIELTMSIVPIELGESTPYSNQRLRSQVQSTETDTCSLDLYPTNPHQV